MAQWLQDIEFSSGGWKESIKFWFTHNFGFLVYCSLVLNVESTNYWDVIRGVGRRPVIHCYIPHRVFAFVIEEKVVDLCFVSFIRMEKCFGTRLFIA